jgi:hypothetical protein
MNTERGVKRDERTVAVENASFKWAYFTLVYGLFLDAIYRHRFLNENVGDLLALGCVSAAISSVYLIRHKAAVSYWPWRWEKSIVVIAVCLFAAVVVSVVLALF